MHNKDEMPVKLNLLLHICLKKKKEIMINPYISKGNE